MANNIIKDREQLRAKLQGAALIALANNHYLFTEGIYITIFDGTAPYNDYSNCGSHFREI